MPAKPLLHRSWPYLFLAVLPVFVHLPALLAGLQVEAWVGGLQTTRLWLLRLGLMALSGTVTFRLLRRLDLAIWPSLVAAILFEFNGTYAWFGQGPALPVAALPLLLLGIEQARARKLPMALILGCALLMVNARQLAIPPYALLTVTWALCRLGGGRREWGLALAGVIIGISATLPAVVPWRGIGLPPTSFVAGDAALVLFPYSFGDPTAPMAMSGHAAAIWHQGGGYLDLTWAVLALSALHGGGRLARARLGVGLFLGGTLSAAAWMAPTLVNPADLLPCWCLAAAILAALALSDWRDALPPTFRRTLLLLMPVLPLTLLPIYLNMLMTIGERRPGLNFSRLITGPSLSIGVQLLFVVVLSALIRHRATTARQAAVTVLLLTNSLGLFVSPMVDALYGRG